MNRRKFRGNSRDRRRTRPYNRYQRPDQIAAKRTLLQILGQSARLLTRDVALSLTGSQWQNLRQRLLTQASKSPTKRHLDLVLLEEVADDIDELNTDIGALLRVYRIDRHPGLIEHLDKKVQQLADYVMQIYRLTPEDSPELLSLVNGSDSFSARSRSERARRHYYYSCFIAYSAQDERFVRQLHGDLERQGVECWFAPEDMKIGDKIRTRIEESIQSYDKLLLVLSANSISNPRVADEVEAAFEKETFLGTTVLFPLALDRAIWDTSEAWAAKIRRERPIADFRAWVKPRKYRAALRRLLQDLKIGTQASEKGT